MEKTYVIHFDVKCFTKPKVIDYLFKHGLYDKTYSNEIDADEYFDGDYVPVYEFNRVKAELDNVDGVCQVFAKYGTVAELVGYVDSGNLIALMPNVVDAEIEITGGMSYSIYSVSDYRNRVGKSEFIPYHLALRLVIRRSVGN